MFRSTRTPKLSLLARFVRVLGITGVSVVLAACKSGPRSVTLDVVTFNYLNRPIFDVFVDGKGGDSSTAYPATGGSTMSGVKLYVGPKQVTWTLDGEPGTPRNGEVVSAKNPLSLNAVPADAVFLAVHIYPDETVELITSRHYPRKTEKGRAMAASHLDQPDSHWSVINDK